VPIQVAGLALLFPQESGSLAMFTAIRRASSLRSLPLNNGSFLLDDTCPFRKSYPRVAMMQSTQDGHSNDGTRPLDCSMQWRILVQ
jgi:hypothetical protein